MQERLLHPLPEAAHLLGIGRSTIYELIAADRIKVVKIGARALVPNDELARFVRSLSEDAAS